MAVSSPDLSEADPAMKLSSAETESDSNDSLQSKGDAKNTLKSNKKAASPKMTLELMAAQWPSHQSVLKQIHPCIFYNIAKKVSSSPPKTSFASAFDISPSLKDSQSSNEMTSDEPLDLSSKTNFDGLVENDARDMHRFKSRLLPLSGRRSYTAEELNSALEDIISGKLGTRRAAVQYNIPRSTLRNKVYKMSSETKRTTPLTAHNVTNMEDLVDNDHEKNYVSADEADGYDATIQDNELSLNQSDNIAARSVEENLEKNKYWCKSIPPSDILHIPKETDIQSEEITDPQGEEQKCKSIYPQEPQQSLTQVEQGVWQNVMLQSLLFPGGLPLQTNLEEAVQILKTVLVNQDLSLFSSQLSSKFQKSQPLFGIHKKNQTHRNKHPSPATSQATNFQNPIPGSQMPKNKFCEDFNEALANDPSVILRIPSFKPVSYFSTPSSSTSSQSGLCNKNENQIFSSSSAKDSKSSTLGAPSIRDQKLSTDLSVLSSNNIPLSSSKSPATVSLREVIANSISRTFNHQAKFDAINSSSDPSTCSPLENCELYKQPSISVIKNIGGTDTYSFGAVPNLLGNCAESNQSQHSYCQTAPNSSMCSGKGTRPKRGKYRNYDRDSLVEAVKAVQRGEMSVHRAGSYYGVPHSTLEYKVKERHLMRPRKRESKSRPSLDDHPGDNNAFCDLSTSIPDSNKTLKISGLSVESKNDVNESSYILQAQSFLNKKKALYSRTTNGIKIPPLLFDQRSPTEQQQSPNLFWQENFEPLQMDTGTHSVPRIDEGETASSGYSQSFSQLELKSQVPCELRREHIKSKLLQGFPMSNSNICTRGQNAEVIAEKLFPSQVSAKGSFLDDIIRKTLDRKISESGKKTPPPLFVPITGCMERNQQNVKRSRNSPINHGSVEVKRERFTATLDSNPKIQSATPEVTTMNLIEGIHKANPDIASTSICNKSSLESSSQGSHLENVKYGIEDSL